MHKIEQSGGTLGKLFGPLLKTGLPLMKKRFNIIRINNSSNSNRCSYSQEYVWIRYYIIPNEEINDIMKKVKSLKEYALLIKDVSENIKK